MSDPAIRIGSIVVVHARFSGIESIKPPVVEHIGIVTRENVFNPGGVSVAIPGKGSFDFPTEQCYNATEEQRKKYFLALLEHGE